MAISMKGASRSCAGRRPRQGGTLLVDGVLGRSHEPAADAQQGFEDGPGIDDGEPDADGHQGGQQEERALPGVRMKLALREHVERRIDQNEAMMSGISRNTIWNHPCRSGKS